MAETMTLPPQAVNAAAPSKADPQGQPVAQGSDLASLEFGKLIERCMEEPSALVDGTQLKGAGQEPMGDVPKDKQEVQVSNSQNLLGSVCNLAGAAAVIVGNALQSQDHEQNREAQDAAATPPLSLAADAARGQAPRVNVATRQDDGLKAGSDVRAETEAEMIQAVEKISSKAAEVGAKPADEKPAGAEEPTPVPRGEADTPDLTQAHRSVVEQRSPEEVHVAPDPAQAHRSVGEQGAPEEVHFAPDPAQTHRSVVEQRAPEEVHVAPAQALPSSAEGSSEVAKVSVGVSRTTPEAPEATPLRPDAVPGLIAATAPANDRAAPLTGDRIARSPGVAQVLESDVQAVEQVVGRKSGVIADGGQTSANHVLQAVSGDVGVSTDSGATPANQATAAQVTPPPDQTTGARIIHQIVQSVRTTTFDGGMNMTMRLDPPHLGVVRLDVSSHDGIVSAHLQTSSPAAKQALDGDLSMLRKALADAGVNVDTINVSIGHDRSSGWNAQGHSHGQYADGGQRAAFLADPLAHAVEPLGDSMETASSNDGQFDYLA